MKTFLLFFWGFTVIAFSQDTISYQWPVPPFNATHEITGTFCEFRNTLSSNHFHNAADVPKADGSPVYPVLDGVITAISPSSVSGTSAYVRVEGTINGVLKSIAYVHIEPAPNLSVGQSVKTGETVLGHILSGMGHTHLTDGRFNYEINGLRRVGGLKPFVDTYPPKILWVKFYKDNSNIEFTTKKIYGNVDIVSQMVEVNGNAQPNTGSTSNNGVYQNGYKILSADKSTVLFPQSGNGTRYKFDWKPNDADANVAYTMSSDVSNHIYYLTNGAGNIGTTRLQRITNNYFNSSLLPVGAYQLMVFAIDTYGNADTVYVPFEIGEQDNIPPAQPVLQYVVNDSINKITLRWKANTEPDLKGYRIYYTLNGSQWILYKDENIVTSAMTSYSFTGISSKTPVYFKICAVDDAPITNVSEFSDVYGLRPNTPGKKVLIVDAFDRTTGSYKKSSHNFAYLAGTSISSAPFETAHNSALTGGLLSLTDYDAVLWMFGDESADDTTFGAAEQQIAVQYLKQGGKIFASGSNVASSLDRNSGPSAADRDFLHNYFKTSFAGENSNSNTVAGTSTVFPNGISFSFGDTLNGSPYQEMSPVYINPAENGIVAASFVNNLTAMTAYKGMFPDGTANGAVVFSSVPFETIHAKNNRDAVLNAVLKYFDFPTSIQQLSAAVPNDFAIFNNYPNPFNPATTIKYQLPISNFVSLKIYDLLGREAAVLVHETQNAGTYAVEWNASEFSSGIYIVKMETENFSVSKKIVLAK